MAERKFDNSQNTKQIRIFLLLNTTPTTARTSVTVPIISVIGIVLYLEFFLAMLTDNYAAIIAVFCEKNIKQATVRTHYVFLLDDKRF